MKMRIALLAACTSTLALAPLDFALAFGASSDSMALSITGVASEPAIRLAQGAPVRTSRSNKKAGKAAEANEALIGVSTTRGRRVPTGKPSIGSRSGKTAKQCCDGDLLGQVSTTRGRKIKPAKTGKGAIFDRWGSTTGEVISY